MARAKVIDLEIQREMFRRDAAQQGERRPHVFLRTTTHCVQNLKSPLGRALHAAPIPYSIIKFVGEQVDPVPDGYAQGASERYSYFLLHVHEQ